MDFQTFCNTILRKAAETLPDTMQLSLRTVLKNNDTEHTALYIRCSDTACSPAVYLEPYYQEYIEGVPLQKLLADILHYFTAPYLVPSFHRFLRELTDPRPYLQIRLIQTGRNARLLSDVPYEPYLDLAAVCELSFEGIELNGTALIHCRHLEEWGLTKEELFACAWKNSMQTRSPILRPIEESYFLFERTGIPLEDVPSPSDLLSGNGQKAENRAASLRDVCRRWLSMMHSTRSPLFAITNRQCFHGAACILYPNVLAQVAYALENDLYLIPSSIHEMLATPACRSEEDLTPILTEILQEVNEESVETADILGSHIYRYDRHTCRLRCLSPDISGELSL